MYNILGTSFFFTEKQQDDICILGRKKMQEEVEEVRSVLECKCTRVRNF